MEATGGGGWGGAVDRERRTASQINRGDVKCRGREKGHVDERLQDGCLACQHTFNLTLVSQLGLVGRGLCNTPPHPHLSAIKTTSIISFYPLKIIIEKNNQSGVITVPNTVSHTTGLWNFLGFNLGRETCHQQVERGRSNSYDPSISHSHDTNYTHQKHPSIPNKT